MKIYRYMLLWTMLLALAACSHDSDDTPVQPKEEHPAFTLGKDTLKVKIGADNKVTVPIVSGGGDYRAFTLDTTVARVVNESGVIKVEGFKNGTTDLVLTDKYDRYRRAALSVYTTDEIQLSTYTLTLTTPLGFEAGSSLYIMAGNGGYSYTCDNEKVKVAFDEETGEVSVTATSRVQPYEATVTITDVTKISKSFKVVVNPVLDPFTADELSTIKKMTRNRAMFNNYEMTRSWMSWVHTVTTEGKQRVKLNVDWYQFFLDFDGDLAVGKKTGGVFTNSYFAAKPQVADQACDVEVIQNNGTTVWVIFSWVDEAEEKLHRGYFIVNI